MLVQQKGLTSPVNLVALLTGKPLSAVNLLRLVALRLPSPNRYTGNLPYAKPINQHIFCHFDAALPATLVLDRCGTIQSASADAARRQTQNQANTA